MIRFLVLAFVSGSALALSPAAKEFMSISAKLETLQCEKRKLRREIALTEAQRLDSSELRKKFAALDRDPTTARLERRLGELEPRVSRSADPEDLAAISRQQREAYYRCE